MADADRNKTGQRHEDQTRREETPRPTERSISDEKSRGQETTGSEPAGQKKMGTDQEKQGGDRGSQTGSDR